MFRKVLVANRGEIAVRVIQTLQQMGIAAAAVYSEPDRDAPHVRMADEAHPLRGASAVESYLDAGQLLDAARRSGADAVHPGYGFLSESAAFAGAVEAAGICWIGPPADVIRAMGDKPEARRRMRAAGVPVVPGWEGAPEPPAAMQRIAGEVGYPLLVKAAAGGGGKGMRRVDAPAALEAAIASASREAEAAFGDGRVFLERYLPRVRHVEVQVFGDAAGRVVHLFERECSVQRRHQKIVEESPSPALDAALRARMGEAAVAAAAAAGYRNAGTVEFLLDPEGRFYFLEMNTRLQVEHPVTELVTGHDLVRAQLQVAAGGSLPFRQEDLRQAGHALECRIYAEDPDRGFLPETGTVRVYRPPLGPGIRVDSGIREGSAVTAHYDPLLAKLIVRAEDRTAALARMDWALSRFVILGIRTNLPFLRRLVAHPAFRAGDLHTHFLEEHPIAAAPPAPAPEVLAAAALALRQRAGTAAGGPVPPGVTPSPWRDAGPWRLD